MTGCSRIAAMAFSSPPQFGQCPRSSSTTRLSSRAQLSRTGPWCAQFASHGKNGYGLTSQALAVFLPVKSVGVMGDGRTYEYVLALRAVVTSNFMPADWAEFPYPFLKRVS
jgi:hypothetical protein